MFSELNAAALSQGNMTFGERSAQAGQMLLLGMLMVFAVLALLWGILSVMKIFTYNIPEKKKAEMRARSQKSDEAVEEKSDMDAEPDLSGDGATVAAITAAIAVLLEEEAAKEGRKASGFRVVSFARRGEKKSSSRKIY